MTLARRLPLIGLAGLIAFIPFGIAGEQLSIALCVAALLLIPAERKRAIRLFQISPAPWGKLLPLSIAVWIGVLLISLALSGQIGAGVRELRKVPLLVALLLPAAVLRDGKGVERAAGWLLFAALAAACAGFVEHARGLGLNPDRLDGPIDSYMTTAGILLQLSLVASALLLERRYLRGLVVAAWVAITAALFLTYTRGAWIGWAAGGALLLGRRRPKALLPALLVTVALVAAHPALRERALTIADIRFPTNSERLSLWKAGGKAFLERPLFGHGLHDLHMLVAQTAQGASYGKLSHFHSDIVQTAVASGAAGLLAVVLVMTAFFHALFRIAKRSRSLAGRALAEGAAAALAGFLVHGLFEWNLGDSEVITSLYTVIGLALAADILPPETKG